jgi:hypothetical protein
MNAGPKELEELYSSTLNIKDRITQIIDDGVIEDTLAQLDTAVDYLRQNWKVLLPLTVGAVGIYYLKNRELPSLPRKILPKKH